MTTKKKATKKITKAKATPATPANPFASLSSALQLAIALAEMVTLAADDDHRDDGAKLRAAMIEAFVPRGERSAIRIEHYSLDELERDVAARLLGMQYLSHEPAKANIVAAARDLARRLVASTLGLGFTSLSTLVPEIGKLAAQVRAEEKRRRDEQNARYAAQQREAAAQRKAAKPKKSHGVKHDKAAAKKASKAAPKGAKKKASKASSSQLDAFEAAREASAAKAGDA